MQRRNTAVQRSSVTRSHERMCVSYSLAAGPMVSSTLPMASRRSSAANASFAAAMGTA